MFESVLDLVDGTLVARDRVEVCERISSSSSTPIPGDLRVRRDAGTMVAVPVDSALDVIGAAGRVVQGLAFLPIDHRHESAIDDLISARLAGKALRPIRSRS